MKSSSITYKNETLDPRGRPGANQSLDQVNRDMEIPRCFEAVEGLIDALSEDVAYLGQRLCPVRANVEQGKSETNPGPAVSPIGANLLRLQAKLELIRQGIREINSTLEI